MEKAFLKEIGAKIFTKGALSHLVVGIVFATGARFVYQYFDDQKEKSELIKETNSLVFTLKDQFKKDSVYRVKADTNNTYAHVIIIQQIEDLRNNQSVMAGIMQQIRKKIPGTEDEKIDDCGKLESIINPTILPSQKGHIVATPFHK